MDHTGGVDQVDAVVEIAVIGVVVTVAEAVEQVQQRFGPADVAHDHFDVGADRSDPGRLVIIDHQRSHEPRSFPFAPVDEGVDQRRSQPAGRAGDDRDVGGRSPDHHATSASLRALRRAIAITEACGLTPGASGRSDASFTYTLSVPCTRP